MDGIAFEDVHIGQSASLGKTITETDILLHGADSLDTNSLHFNSDAAAQTSFKGRIAHGMLSAGLISAVLGTKLPGAGSISLVQARAVRRPVHGGDTVTATITALAPATRQATLSTVYAVAGKRSSAGEATVLPPARA